jgi:hypothetical protein
MTMPIRLKLGMAVSSVAVVAAVYATSALAEPAGPHWAIQSVALPSTFTREDVSRCSQTPGEEVSCDAYVVRVTNVGTGSSSGSIVIKDDLPPGMLVGEVVRNEDTEDGSNNVSCSQTVGASSVTCTDGNSIQPEGVIWIFIEVAVLPELGSSPTTVTNVAEVQGGGAASMVTGPPSTVANTVNAAAPPTFGFQDLSVGVFGPGGATEVQAGGHPATMATTLDYTTLLNNSAASARHDQTQFPAVQEPKTEIVDLPPGLLGDPLAAERCPQSLMTNIDNHPGRCPDSRVGEVTIKESGTKVERNPIYDVVPEAGYPAEFAFELDETDVYLRPRLLPTSGGYVLSVSVSDIPRAVIAKVDSVTVALFGDPAERDGGGNGLAFLTSPDDCGAGPLKTRVEMDSWVDPGHWVAAETPFYEAGAGQGVTGCGALRFEPSIEVTPEESTADTPSGYEVDLKVPQAPNVPGILATPDLRDAVVALPEGVSIDPSAGDGLEACPETGPEGIQLGSHDALADNNEPQEG